MSLHRIPKVKTGNGVIVPAHQQGGLSNMAKVMTIEMNPLPPTTALSSGSYHHLRFPHKDIRGNVNSMTLRLDIAGDGSNNMTLTASEYQFKKIEFCNNGQEWYTLYADQAYWEALNLVPDQKQNLTDQNLSKTYYRGTVQSSSSSLTRSYRIPLVSHPWVINEAFISDIRDETTDIKIYWQDGVVSSGSGVPSLSNVALEVSVEEMTDADMANTMTMYNHPQTTKFLEAIHEEYTAKTLNRGVQLSLKLDNSSDKDIAFMLFGIRADSYSASNDGFLKTLALPDGSTVDILDASNKSVFGNGTAPRIEYLQNEVYYHHLDSKFPQYRNWYMIPFCKDVKKSYSGAFDGFLRLGNNYKLAITPSAGAGVAGVISCDLTGTANSAYYKVWVHNKANGITSMTDSILYSTDAEASINALEALTQNPKGPITLTTNGSPTADFTMTYTASDPVEANQLDVKFIWESANATGTEIFSTESVTVDHVPAWTNGSTYTIDVYCMTHRQVNKYRGVIKAQDA